MATNTASIPFSQRLSLRGRPLPGKRGELRQLWQVPALLVGLVALLGVGVTRPLWHTPMSPMERHLAFARKLLEQPAPPLERMQRNVAEALAEANRFPLKAGEGHFLLGSAHLRHADGAPADAEEHWREARAHLEEADHLGVAAADRATLAYRLGKVWFHTGEAPQRVIDQLAPILNEAADDPTEGYAMLAQAYMKLPQPDLEAALEANRRELQTPTLKEEVLAPARLLRGELLLALKRPDEAREILQFVKPPAAPALVARARFLQARTYQDKEQWGTAAQLWKDALQEDTPPAEAAGIRYQLGVCYRHMDQQQSKALSIWEKVMAEAPGDEGAAAALGLAELRLKETDPRSALDAFTRVVRDVKQPADWHNALIDIGQAREVFESGCIIYRMTGHFDLAMQLAELYERIALPGAAQGFFAQAAEAAARAGAETAGGVLEAVEAARKLYQQAGCKYEAALEAATTPAEQADVLWKSADCYIRGQDQAAAIPLLQRWLKLEPPTERLGQAWFLLAEAHRAKRDETAARAAYEESVKYAGPYMYLARYELALVKMAGGKLDDAATDLEVNLQQLRLATSLSEPERDADEKSQFAYGDLLHQQKNYLRAASTLEAVLRASPTGSRALQGRFVLADCYHCLANEQLVNLRQAERTSSNASQNYRNEYRRWLGLAAEAYGAVAKELATRLKSGPLTEEDEIIYRRAALAEADLVSDLGRYEDAIKLYEPLAARYHNRSEELRALAGIATNHFRKYNDAKGREVIEFLKKRMKEMDDSAFGPDGRGSRADWDQWLKSMSK
jgi:tetratricopeptide (TPR) repeat protein